ncbi:MAG TPA: GNAT family N-acetyltransferase [Chthonomonadaceae bacterium]|nr:GNAT family N-acetyltransferase [Chthonomonadaceae bacterium]
MKPQYTPLAIELVAEAEEGIVGLIDIECETQPQTICSPTLNSLPQVRGGMIWNLAVHPDFRRRGIARALLTEARNRAQQWQVAYLQAWTRDDPIARQWYLAQGFQPISSYLHVFLQGSKQIGPALQCSILGLMPVFAFAHYLGEDTPAIRRRFQRAHACCLYQLPL